MRLAVGMLRVRPARCVICCVFLLLSGIPPINAQEQLFDTELVVSANRLDLRGELANIAISPVDQNIISFESVEGGNLHRLWRYDIQDNRVHQISPRGDDANRWYAGAQSDRGIDWSPVTINGKNWFLFVSSGSDESENIYLGNTTDDYYLQLTSGNAVNHHPRWAPDGRRFVYVSSRTGSGDIYLVNNLDRIINRFEREIRNYPENRLIEIEEIGKGYGHVRLTDNPEMDTYPDWSPDGRYIVYQGLHRLNGVLTMDLFLIDMQNLSKTPVNLTQNPWQDAIQPQWSYDQQYIAFYVSPTRERGGIDMPSTVFLSYIEFVFDSETRDIKSFATKGTIGVNIRRSNSDGLLWGPGSRSVLYVKAEGNYTPVLLYKTKLAGDDEREKIIRESRFDIINREITGYVSGELAMVAFLTYEDQDYKIYTARPGGGVLSRRLDDVYIGPIPYKTKWERPLGRFTIGGFGLGFLNQNSPALTEFGFMPQLYLQAAVVPYIHDQRPYELALRISAGSVNPSYVSDTGDESSFSYSTLDLGSVLIFPMRNLIPRSALFIYAGAGIIYSYDSVEAPSFRKRLTVPLGTGFTYSITESFNIVAQFNFRNMNYRTADSPYSSVSTRSLNLGLEYRILN